MKKHKKSFLKFKLNPKLILISLLVILGLTFLLSSLTSTANISIVSERAECGNGIKSLDVSSSCGADSFETYRYTCEGQTDRAMKLLKEGCLPFKTAYQKISSICGSATCPKPTPEICTQEAGYCKNTKGQCVSYTNGCEKSRVCSKQLESCVPESDPCYCPPGAMCKLSAECNNRSPKPTPEICTQEAGYCKNTKGQCVGYADGCEKSRVCSRQLESCTPTRPSPVSSQVNSCNKSCNLTVKPEVGCPAGFLCQATSNLKGADGVCRAASCPGSSDCLCENSPVVTTPPMPIPTLNPADECFCPAGAKCKLPEKCNQPVASTTPYGCYEVTDGPCLFSVLGKCKKTVVCREAGPQDEYHPVSSLAPEASAPTNLYSGVCTADALECPDGTFVGRTGPNCTFAACPRIKNNQKDQTLRVEDSPNYKPSNIFNYWRCRFRYIRSMSWSETKNACLNLNGK